MTRLLFADNTVLINFGLVGRLELLEALLNGRGTWTASVRIECVESSSYPGLRELDGVERFLGVAVEPSDAEQLVIQGIRELLRVPGDPPHKHLGEAETLGIINARSLAALIVRDDTGALGIARRLGIGAATTGALLVLAARARIVTPQDCWDMLVELRNTHGRFLPDAPGSFPDLLARCGFIS